MMSTHDILEQCKGKTHYLWLKSVFQAGKCFDVSGVHLEDIPYRTDEVGKVLWAPFPITVLEVPPLYADCLKSLIFFKADQDKFKDEFIACIYTLGAEDKIWKLLPLVLWNPITREITFSSADKEQAMREEGSLEYTLETISNWLDYAMDIVALISCSKTQFVDHPAPNKLNKKREKKDRPPIVSYKTLILTPTLPIAKSPALGGTHASPREHWRRGHVRRTPSGFTWVSKCKVGSGPGKVIKDYRVEI